MLLSVQSVFAFFFIVARVAGLFLSAPILSDRAIPQTMKLAMVIWTSLLFWFIVPFPTLHADLHLDIILLLLGELMLGLVIGLISRIIFVGVQMAGSLMDMQMGLSAAATFDPSSGGQVTIMERLMFYFAITIFFLSNAHHLLLISLFESFKVIPLAREVQYSGLLDQISHLASLIFLTG
ncbi:MAG: flagellar biosynthetic protein FliR, partial [Candidatus Margulisiibacteriota bacterium]